MDTAAMAEDMSDSDLIGVPDLREKFVESVGQLKFLLIGKLKDHCRRKHLRDRSDPESARRCQRFLLGSVDLAVTDRASVEDIAVFSDGQAPHRLILFSKPVKKLVEFSFVRDLCVASAKQRQCR